MRSVLRKMGGAILLCLGIACSACAPASSRPAVSAPAASTGAPTEKPDKRQRLEVAICEETVRYLGRTLDLNGRKYYNWTCSGFEFRFTGNAVEATLETPVFYANQAEKRPHLAVYVDGATEPHTDIVLDTGSGVYTLAKNLPDGSHTVRVMKVSANRYSGPFYTSALTLYGEETAPALLPPPAAPDRRIEFIGDSITNGFGILALGAGGGYVSAEEDGSQAYAYLTAGAFGADASFLSISGFGVYADLAGAKSNALPRYYPYDDLSLLSQAVRAEEHLWDFSKNPSDAVVIHLGTNDAGPVLNPGVKIDGVNVAPEFRLAEYRAAYTAFLHTVREKNPKAYIFCIIGGLDCGLEGTIREIVQQYQQDTNDTRISFYSFQVNAAQVPDGLRAGHPSAAVHRRMAEELITQIRSVTGWESR